MLLLLRCLRERKETALPPEVETALAGRIPPSRYVRVEGFQSSFQGKWCSFWNRTAPKALQSLVESSLSVS